MLQISLNPMGKRRLKPSKTCLRDGWLAGFGERTIEFERRVADLFGKKHGLFVNSGSSAILSRSLRPQSPKGLGGCDTLLVVSLQLSHPSCNLGLKPVFCDVGLNSYVPTVEQLKKVVTPETKCLLLPNLIGNVPDWPEIRKAFPDLILFEDSADTITHTQWYGHKYHQFLCQSCNYSGWYWWYGYVQ